MDVFTRPMKLNKEETKRLVRFLNSKKKSNYKIKTAESKKVSKKTLDKIFDEAKEV